MRVMIYEIWSEKSITSHEQVWFAGANMDNHTKQIQNIFSSLLSYLLAMQIIKSEFYWTVFTENNWSG